MKQAARRIVEKLRRKGYQAFFAGGWVRDFLLGRRPKDIDIATSARPDEVLRLFPGSRAIGAQFGVVQIHSYGHVYEVATFRTEAAYLDGRHPSSVTFSGPEQDALRRDFTINGLFYDPVEERVIDYVHGREDLQARVIRTIGDPTERFSEDRLRMLRAIRLACSLGFDIVPETWRAIRKLSGAVVEVSHERIRDELIRIFTGPNPGRGLGLLYDSGLLEHIVPEVAALARIRLPRQGASRNALTRTCRRLSLLRRPSVSLAFATLLQDVGTTATEGSKIAGNICRRLRMSNEEIEQVGNLISAHPAFLSAAEMRKSTLVRLLRKPDIDEHLELLRVNCLSAAHSLEAYRYCKRKLEEYHDEVIAPALINGEDLIAMGYSPGPIFKRILGEVEDLQIEGRLKTREEALDHIRKSFPLQNPRCK